MYKVYGLTEPGKVSVESVRYVGYTAKPLRERLGAHYTYNVALAHTPRSVWIHGLRERGERPGIILLYEHRHSGLIQFVEAFYAHRLALAGNDILNCMDNWGPEKGTAARDFAVLYQSVTLSDRQLHELTDYYFRFLASGSDKERYCKQLTINVNV